LTRIVGLDRAAASLTRIFEELVYSSNVFCAQATELKTGPTIFDPPDSCFDFSRRVDGGEVKTKLYVRTKSKSICWFDRHTAKTDIQGDYGDLFLISGDLYRYFTFIPTMGAFFMHTQISNSKIGPTGLSHLNLPLHANAIT
jgi:hypothetical protein